jgi:putative membrane protein
MAFIDNLGFELGLMVLTTAVAFYTGFVVWWYRRQGDLARSVEYLRGGGLMLGVLGLFLSILGFWGELAWPLPGQYNLLFYDPTLLGGMMLVGFAVTVYYRIPTQYLGVVGGVAGLGIAYYGARGYMLNLTKEPLEMFLLFLGFGVMMALSYPVTLFVDWYVLHPGEPAADTSPGAKAPAYPAIWNAPVLLFLALTALAGIAAILMGFNTVWSHLEYAP